MGKEQGARTAKSALLTEEVATGSQSMQQPKEKSKQPRVLSSQQPSAALGYKGLTASLLLSTQQMPLN